MKAIITFCLISFLGASIFNFSKNKPFTYDEDEPYAPTIFPADTTQLWIGEGDFSSDTVLLINEGGPKVHLDFEYNGKSQWAYLPRYFHYYRANVHQVGTYNKEIFNFKKNFTRAMAEKEADNNSEILYRAFKYFKDRGKTVIVIGHSFGAFAIPYCMMTRPLAADGYLITAGRLDHNEARNEYFLKGYNSQFEDDGITFIPPDTTKAPNPHRGERYFRMYRVKQLLKGVMGVPRFTQVLADKDLSKMIYYYAKDDKNVGALTSAEVDFLKSKGATVFATEGGHYEIWKRAIDAVLVVDLDGTLIRSDALYECFWRALSRTWRTLPN
ncbi:MAG: hypothetical protein AAF573_23325, partial [Bacteroidota bacterium]